jgi:hypothetical protein
LASNTWQVAIGPRWPAFLILVAAAGLPMLVPAVRRRSGTALRAALALAAGGLTYGLAMGTLGWVAANGFSFKYWIPVVLLTYTALAAVALAPLAALPRPPSPRALALLCGPSLLVAVAVTYGLPSRARARAALDLMPQQVPLPQRTAEVLMARATHLLGSYGEVWPSVFHANLILYERGEDRRVWAVGGRSMATWDLWGRMPLEDLRIAAFLDEQSGAPGHDARAYLGAYFPPAEVVGKYPSLFLYRPADELPRERSSGRAGLVLASWHSGFFGPEGTPESNTRWCGSSTGKLTLTNTTGRPLSVTLRLQPQTGHKELAQLWIDSPLFTDRVRINAHTPPRLATFAVPPGKHVLCFSCDAPPTPDPYYLRPQFFCLRDFALAVQEDTAAAPAAP